MALNGRNAGNTSGEAERDPRLERLYREAAREAPPAHLDAAILAAARREAGARPLSVTSGLRRWHVPVSIAAVVILSVTLVILVREEGGETIVPAPVPAVAPPAELPAAPGAGPALADVARGASQPQPPDSPLPLRSSREDVRASVATSRSVESTPPELGRSTASSAGVVATQEASAKPSQDPLLSMPSLAEERAAPRAPDAVTTGRMAGARSEPGEPPVAHSAAEPAQARSMAQAMQVKPPEQDRLPVWHDYEKEPPQKWLVRIEELRRAGRAVEAEQMLAEFKRRFPGHPQP